MHSSYLLVILRTFCLGFSNVLSEQRCTASSSFDIKPTPLFDGKFNSKVNTNIWICISLIYTFFLIFYHLKWVLPSRFSHLHIMFPVGLKWAIKQFLLEPATLIQTSAIAFEIFGQARRACRALVCCQGYGNAITRGSCSGISAWLSSNLRWSKRCLLPWLENKITLI